MERFAPESSRVAEVTRIAPRETEFVRDLRGPNRFLVARSAFTSESVLRAEKERVFSTCWIYVGHESEIPEPGDFVAREVAGRPVLFTRNREGRCRVLLNSCSHRGAEVCRKRRGNQRRFRCFYHSWSFSNDGELVSMPDEDGFPEGFRKQDHGLATPHAVDSYRGFVFATFNPVQEPLLDYLADARFYLDLTADQAPEAGMAVTPGTHEYSMRSNWKLLAENSSDGYHAIPVHKTYLDVQRSKGDQIAGSTDKDWKQSHAFDLGNGHTVTVKQAPWGRPIARWQPSMGESTRDTVERSYRKLELAHGRERAELIANLDFNMLIFPNLVINNIMAVIIRTFYPTAPGHMNVSAWSLAPSDESPDARRVRNESFLSFLGPAGLATPDDNEALESCQRGYAARAGEGWNDVSRGMDKADPPNWDELQMRTFWRRWDELMGGRA
ncbi:aromatic ring-hydroxylating dioxygenase subunit alpha [Saccharomonospora sp. NPDC006951]